MMRTIGVGLSALLLSACAGPMGGSEDMAEAPPSPEMAEEAATGAGMAAAQNMAHAHMGHVSDAWEDTPDGMGFLPTARAEAEIAAQHADLAAERPDDLEWMQMHAAHVVHALDPTMEAAGPGLGYGVKAAADNARKHIVFASESDGASDNVKLHAEHVATSTGNVVTWSDMLIDTAEQVRAADSAEAAAPLVMEMQGMADAILNGIDANGDGQATWEQGEGGIAQAEQHMQFMREGEGLS